MPLSSTVQTARDKIKLSISVLCDVHQSLSVAFTSGLASVLHDCSFLVADVFDTKVVGDAVVHQSAGPQDPP